MRRRLERLTGQRHTFQAIFIRFGKVHKPDGRTRRYMLIEDVEDARGRHITLHMWMPLRAQEYIDLPLRCGDAIRFEAEVNMYMKGSIRHRKIDYGLVRPRNVERVELEIEQEA